MKTPTNISSAIIADFNIMTDDYISGISDGLRLNNFAPLAARINTALRVGGCPQVVSAGALEGIITGMPFYGMPDEDRIISLVLEIIVPAINATIDEKRAALMAEIAVLEASRV